MSTSVNWHEINRQVVDGDKASLLKGYAYFRWEPGIEAQKIARLYRMELDRREALEVEAATSANSS